MSIQTVSLIVTAIFILSIAVAFFTAFLVMGFVRIRHEGWHRTLLIIWMMALIGCIALGIPSASVNLTNKALSTYSFGFLPAIRTGSTALIVLHSVYILTKAILVAFLWPEARKPAKAKGKA